MNRTIAGVALALLAAGCAAAVNQPADPVAEEAAIRARGSEMMAAENRRDTTAALAFYTSDAVVQAPGMPAILGKDGIRRLYQQSMRPDAPRVEGAFDQRVIAVSANGDLAWEHGTATTRVETAGGTLTLTSKQLIIWKKVAGQWLVAGMSYSGNAPAPRTPPSAPK